MHSDKIIKEYIEMVKSNPERYFKDYQVSKEMAKGSTAYYKGEPVPFSYQPFLIDLIDVETFKYILEFILSIGKKVTYKYIEDSEYRKLFGFPKFIEDMILVDNGYGVIAPIGRFDIFYRDRDDFMFCEINTDGSSAMNEDMVLGGILLQGDGLKDFSKNYHLSQFELFDSWVEESLELYKKYDPTNQIPNVAIMDLVESATTTEFKEFKKAFERAGCETQLVDVRNLEYRDGKLYNGDFRIDMIYRRLVTFELIEHADECQEFIKAYMDKAMCTIGSIQSQVIHNKIFFKILFDKETREFLSQEEIDFIDRHVPYTGVLGGSKKILEKLKADKDKYIVKPMDMNASQGVYTGRDMTKEEWEESLERDFDKDFIYQEFVEHKTQPFVSFDQEGQAVVQEMANTLGIFGYNEKFAGIYVRVGVSNIIKRAEDALTAPGILAVRRDMKDLISRINELSQIFKERELTEEEAKERADLRREYVLRFRAGAKETLLNIKVVDEEGRDVTEEKLNKLYKEKNKR